MAAAIIIQNTEQNTEIEIPPIKKLRNPIYSKTSNNVLDKIKPFGTLRDFGAGHLGHYETFLYGNHLGPFGTLRDFFLGHYKTLWKIFLPFPFSLSPSPLPLKIPKIFFGRFAPPPRLESWNFFFFSNQKFDAQLCSAIARIARPSLLRPIAAENRHRRVHNSPSSRAMIEIEPRCAKSYPSALPFKGKSRLLDWRAPMRAEILLEPPQCSLVCITQLTLSHWPSAPVAMRSGKTIYRFVRPK